MNKMKKRVLAAMLVAVTFGSMSAVGTAAIAPGQCKKQGPSDCSGNSECAGPHKALLPLGQQKKCPR
jgi:hypothetical protein